MNKAQHVWQRLIPLGALLPIGLYALTPLHVASNNYNITIQPDTITTRLDTLIIKPDTTDIKLDTITKKSDVSDIKSDTITIQSDTIALQLDTIATLPDTIAILPDTIAFQPDTIAAGENISEEEEEEEGSSKIILLHTDNLRYDAFKSPNTKILTGHVAFLHDSIYMYCDSARFYETTNSFDAFRNVRMVQGDTLELLGDKLFYDGREQLARVRENVVLTHNQSKLYTDSLDYDRLYQLGYFFEGGRLVDGENTLTSDWGQYAPPTHQAVFNYNVLLTNPKFTLISDTLYYNTQTGLAEISGPSNIDSGLNHIYSESGCYDTHADHIILLERSLVTNNGRKITADSLFYDTNIHQGEGFGNSIFTDEQNKNMMLSQYCLYNDSLGYTMTTDSAIAVDFSQPDTLWMHADTFKIFTININTDSVYREMHGYHKVRSYRTDIQGVCDSLVYITRDSCITMYRDPIVWNGEQQVLGEVIKIYLNDSTIERIHVMDQTLSAERLDTIHFNQVAGKEMICYFRDGELEETEVNTNVYADYYMFDDDSLMIGLNYTETSQLRLFMRDRKMRKIWMPAAAGTIYPIVMIPANRLYLDNFVWFDYIRPTSRHDIFLWRPKRAGTELKASVKRVAPLQTLDQVKGKRGGPR